MIERNISFSDFVSLFFPSLPPSAASKAFEAYRRQVKPTDQRGMTAEDFDVDQVDLEFGAGGPLVFELEDDEALEPVAPAEAPSEIALLLQTLDRAMDQDDQSQVLVASLRFAAALAVRDAKIVPEDFEGCSPKMMMLAGAGLGLLVSQGVKQDH